MVDYPLISIIIPTFNREKVIPISLESVLGQTYKNLEIIVVDDCSEDHTRDVISAYGDPRIQYIRHSKNLGGAVARNTGINLAKGEYIAFLDSDDAWVPNKLDIQYSHIKSHSHPQNIVSYTQVFHSLSGISKSTFDEFNPKFYLPKRGKGKSELIGDYIICNHGKTLTSTLMLHQRLAKSTRFRDQLRKHQDWDFCLRLEANGAEFSFLEKPLTIWNGDPSFEHVGRNPNYELSELWLKECRKYLSFQAIARFNLEKILPALMEKRTQKIYIQKILAEGLLLKQIPFRKFLKLSKKAWI
ncbi:MAG: glycosyltransferase family 2 protein [Leptolyngbya sp. SIO1D8]|nr:glycosyltransferase family 2 protein [Leptolyngbya sp. SIO1D8]